MASKVQNYLDMQLHAMFFHFALDENSFDPKWHRDFYDGGPVGEKRANFNYYPPKGWFRYALKVSGKYADENWLAFDGRVGEWAVAYHGTPASNCKSISNLKSYLDKVTQFGTGVYCSPFVDEAEKYCTNTGTPDCLFEIETKDEGKVKFKMAFMCRVDPTKITQHSPTVWTVPSANDIRPYGVLLKRV